MMRGFLMGVGLVMLGCFAMVFGGVIVVLGSRLVMLDYFLLGHGSSSLMVD
jgi:hypothetical protein